MNARIEESAMAEGYNFAYLDEQTKRMIRRALLKAVAVPGHQVPFASREMPLPYGWGTGGLQVTSAIIGRSDTLKVIDQGSDETTNAVNIRRFFARTAGVATTTRTVEASIVQTRHRIPETPLTEAQILVYQVPMPEPLFRLEPRVTEMPQAPCARGLRADQREVLRGHRAAWQHCDDLRLPGARERPLSHFAFAHPEVRQPQDAHEPGAATLRRGPRTPHLCDPALYEGQEPRFRGSSVRPSSTGSMNARCAVRAKASSTR